MNQSSLCFALQRASSNHSKKWSHKGSWCSKSRLVFFTWAEFSCARYLEGTCSLYLQKSLPHTIELITLYYAFISLQPDITAPVKKSWLHIHQLFHPRPALKTRGVLSTIYCPEPPYLALMLLVWLHMSKLFTPIGQLQPSNPLLWLPVIFLNSSSVFLFIFSWLSTSILS